jgi:hypothetical protein
MSDSRWRVTVFAVRHSQVTQSSAVTTRRKTKYVAERRTRDNYLKIYSNTKQDNWVSLLPMAQMAYNDKRSEATGQTPYFANHGRNPNLFQRTLPSPKAEAAIKSAEEMKEVYETIHDNMLKAQRNSISHVNKKRKTAP